MSQGCLQCKYFYKVFVSGGELPRGFACLHPKCSGYKYKDLGNAPVIIGNWSPDWCPGFILKEEDGINREVFFDGPALKFTKEETVITKRKDFSVIDCGACHGKGKTNEPYIPPCGHNHIIATFCRECRGSGLLIITHKKKSAKEQTNTDLAELQVKYNNMASIAAGRKKRIESLERSLANISDACSKVENDGP